MSEFIDVYDIAIRNRIAVDGRVSVSIEDWNALLTHIDNIEQEPTIADYLKANEAMLTKTKAKMVTIESLKDFAGIK